MTQPNKNTEETVMESRSDAIKHFVNTANRLADATNPEHENYDESVEHEAEVELDKMVVNVSTRRITSLDLAHNNYHAVLMVSWTVDNNVNPFRRKPVIEWVRLVSADGNDINLDELELREESKLTGELWNLAVHEVQVQFESDSHY